MTKRNVLFIGFIGLATVVGTTYLLNVEAQQVAFKDQAVPPIKVVSPKSKPVVNKLAPVQSKRQQTFTSAVSTILDQPQRKNVSGGSNYPQPTTMKPIRLSNPQVAGRFAQQTGSRSFGSNSNTFGVQGSSAASGNLGRTYPIANAQPAPRKKDESEKYLWICQTDEGKILFGDVTNDAEFEIKTKYSVVKIPIGDITALKVIKDEKEKKEVRKKEAVVASLEETKAAPSDQDHPSEIDDIFSNAETKDVQQELAEIDDIIAEPSKTSQKLVVAVKDGSMFYGTCEMKDLKLKTDWGEIKVEADAVKTLSSTGHGSMAIGKRNDGTPGWVLAPAALVIERRQLVPRQQAVMVTTGR